MKKMIKVLILTGIMVLSAGCSASDKQGDENKSVEKENNISENTDKTEAIVERPEPADYIQSAIDYADKIGGSGLVMDDEGNILARDKNTKDTQLLVTLYSCYGKNIRQIRKWGDGSLLILTEEGDVYHNTKLVSQGKNVVDMLWKTNNVGVNAVFLLENGKYINYLNNFKVETRENTQSDKLAIAACRWREDLMLLDAEGNYDCGSHWKNCEVKGWKDIVVLACRSNDDTNTSTIAGIAADGTVYATGDFAEDILSWGELAYISMDDELIVGMKKDGTLVFSGEKGAMYSELDNIGPVKGVRLWRGELWAITEEGVLYSYYEHASEANIQYGSAENGGCFDLKMDKDGNIYKNSYADDKWVLTDYPKADAENADGLIFYQLLLNSETDTRKISDFLVRDINNDGIDEVIVKDFRGDYDAMVKIYANHGYLDAIVKGTTINGYYPNAGIVVCSVTGGGETKVNYVELASGKTLGTKYSNKYSDTPTYYDNVTGEYNSEVTEEAFYEMLNNYVKEEEMCTITKEDFIENTEENLRKAFLK